MGRNSQVIQQQQQILKAILQPLLPQNSQYALIDFPDHSNVGDSAIWVGEIDLLKNVTGNYPCYISKIENFDLDALNRVLPDGPILIHGGGNFGDIWRKHQDFREYLMKVCKGRTLIQLPQSIKFDNEQSIKSCADSIKQHGNFHLLVRDKPSLDFAQKHFSCHVELSPDSAFGIGEMQRTSKPDTNLFMLLRNDTERAAYDRSPLLALNGVDDDWLDDPSFFHQKSKLIAILTAIRQGRKPNRLDYYQTLATGRVMRGVRMLSRGKRVVTDRLHAHIISTLLDIPHVALDNNYGKVSGYINAWTHSYSQVRVANSAQDAIQKLDSLDPI
jgi:exopolysaccharide biosynthesis predicted pyruvyltransferase EpsI